MASQNYIFDTLDKKGITSRLEARSAVGDETEKIQVNRKLYDGDHWLEGTGWIGPIPATSDKTYNDIKAEIMRIFCSRNVVKEVVDRTVDGLLGRDPRRAVTRANAKEESENEDAQQDKKLLEAQSMTLDFWEKRQNLKILKEVMGRQKLGEHVCVRLYVPRGLLVDTPQGKGFPRGSIEECLDKIYVHVTQPNQAAVVTDADTQRPIAVYNEKREKGEYLEAVYGDDEDPTITILRVFDSDFPVLDADGSTPEETGVRFELKIGGRLTIFEPNVRAIVSEQFRENQFAINLAKTMQSRNVVTGGFLERVILDAMPPGRWIDDPEHPGKQIYEVSPFKVGGGTTNFYMGAEYRDDQGNTVGRGKPSVHFRDPVANDTFIDAKRDCYQDILEEVGQSHILISGDATASGKSRQQAREAFQSGLEDDKGELDPLAVWLLETPLAMAAFFAGQPNYFEGYSADASCYVNTGPLSDGERTAIISEWESGLISDDTAMSRLGVDDVVAEKERLKKSRAAAARQVEIEAMQASDFTTGEIQRRVWDLNDIEIAAMQKERNGDGFPAQSTPPVTGDGNGN